MPLLHGVPVTLSLTCPLNPCHLLCQQWSQQTHEDGHDATR